MAKRMSPGSLAGEAEARDALAGSGASPKPSQTVAEKPSGSTEALADALDELVSAMTQHRRSRALAEPDPVRSAASKAIREVGQALFERTHWRRH